MMKVKQLRWAGLVIALIVLASLLLYARTTAPPPYADVTNPGILSVCYDNTNGAMRLVAPPVGSNSCTAGIASSGFTCNPNITNSSDPCFCVSGGPRNCSNAENYVEK